MRHLAGAGRDTYISNAAGHFAAAKAFKVRQDSLDAELSTKRDCSRLKRLTVHMGRDYIAALGRTAALARWRVREAPHCLRGESSGHSLGHDGCMGVGGSGSGWRHVPRPGFFDGTVRFRAV